jgi:hypothetical protein
VIGKEIILGLVSIGMGGGMFYRATSSRVSDGMKAFFSAWWIKSERVNKVISGVLGFFSLVNGVVYFVAGIIGRDIWPIH